METKCFQTGCDWVSDREPASISEALMLLGEHYNAIHPRLFFSRETHGPWLEQWNRTEEEWWVYLVPAQIYPGDDRRKYLHEVTGRYNPYQKTMHPTVLESFKQQWEAYREEQQQQEAQNVDPGLDGPPRAIQGWDEIPFPGAVAAPRIRVRPRRG